MHPLRAQDNGGGARMKSGRVRSCWQYRALGSLAFSDTIGGRKEQTIACRRTMARLPPGGLPNRLIPQTARTPAVLDAAVLDERAS